jgi:hypothetical protein
MWVLHLILFVFGGSFIGLMIGVLYKIGTYPTKLVKGFDSEGNEITRRVDDPDYHYKDEELVQSFKYGRMHEIHY